MSIYQTIITIPRWSITVSSLRTLPYRSNWNTLYRGIGLTVLSELRIIYSPLLILYRGNLITIYHGIGLTVSLELRIFYSPLSILYRSNLITIYRTITYIALLQKCYLLFSFWTVAVRRVIWRVVRGRTCQQCGREGWGAMITVCIHAWSAQHEREWAMF